MITVHEHLSVLKVNDEITMKELETAVKLASFKVNKLSPTTIVVNTDYLDKLINLLQRRGYNPKFEG